MRFGGIRNWVILIPSGVRGRWQYTACMGYTSRVSHMSYASDFICAFMALPSSRRGSHANTSLVCQVGSNHQADNIYYNLCIMRRGRARD